ncbi:MAG TPA: Uma2 family endonuclease [Polyangiaceae bacterium]|nr:Uma2 family endonuclease [Polyangiaceae bacterium]
MSLVPSRWTVDPNDPRAPPTEIWKSMTDEERALVVATLPSEFPPSEASPPEGDDHFDAFSGARDALRRWYGRRGRRIYVAGNLPVYYPGERMFSPDLIAVDNAEQRQRDSWIVDAEEGKGLDVAVEIVVRGERKKDLERNVERYAALGIPEYYLFDRRRMTLAAWELDGDRYRRRVPQSGRYDSPILGLDLWLDGDRLRFSVGDAPVPYADELIDRVSRLSAEAHDRVQRLEAELAEEQRRREEEQRRREEEQHRREEEQRRREAAEAAVEELRAELERLRGRSD